MSENAAGVPQSARMLRRHRVEARRTGERGDSLDDAHRLDERVRERPEKAYDLDFYQSFAAEVGWRLG